MGIRKPLTAEEKLFIVNNRRTMSMNDLSKHINKHYNRIRTYMIENNLQLTKDEVQELRVKKYEATRNSKEKKPKERIKPNNNFTAPKWKHKPWDLGLNLITMYRS